MLKSFNAHECEIVQRLLDNDHEKMIKVCMSVRNGSSKSTQLLELPPSFMQVGQAASNLGKALLGLLVDWNGSVNKKNKLIYIELSPP